MKKYIQVEHDDKFETKYEYEIGEEITINNRWVKCTRKEVIKGELIQFFITQISMYTDELNEMQDKLAQANDNISMLISEIVSLKEARDSEKCCDVEAMESHTCDSKCEECKQRFYENMEEYLNNKYQVCIDNE